MGPMEVHSHNDHRLNKYKLKKKNQSLHEIKQTCL